VLFAPLLHLNGAHLMANAIPLFILLVLLFWDRKYHPERTMAIIWVFSGLGTWLIGRGNACHIGASSLIYGLVVYFIVAAFRMRSWRAAIVAILVFIFYGGIFYGMVPQKEMVSWEGHLSGAISGWIAARWNHR
jgi:membrane associated rhomboid family serine protease